MLYVSECLICLILMPNGIRICLKQLFLSTTCTYFGWNKVFYHMTLHMMGYLFMLLKICQVLVQLDIWDVYPIITLKDHVNEGRTWNTKMGTYQEGLLFESNVKNRYIVGPFTLPLSFTWCFTLVDFENMWLWFDLFQWWATSLWWRLWVKLIVYKFKVAYSRRLLFKDERLGLILANFHLLFMGDAYNYFIGWMRSTQSVNGEGHMWQNDVIPVGEWKIVLGRGWQALLVFGFFIVCCKFNLCIALSVKVTAVWDSVLDLEKVAGSLVLSFYSLFFISLLFPFHWQEVGHIE